MTPKLVKFFTAALLLISLGEAAPVKAADLSHVKRLLETKECSGCDLSRANLSGADLSFAILVNANLMGANLKGANVSGADLTRANLSEADLSGANLNQAFLTSANLDQTNLTGASTNGLRGLPVIAVLPSILPAVSVPRQLPIPSAVSVPPQSLPLRERTISISSSSISQRTQPLSDLPLLPDVMAAPSQEERPPHRCRVKVFSVICQRFARARVDAGSLGNWSRLAVSFKSFGVTSSFFAGFGEVSLIFGRCLILVSTYQSVHVPLLSVCLLIV